MQDFRNMELTALLDMLSAYTAKYTKMLSDGSPKDDSNACRDMIHSLQKELETRKRYGIILNPAENRGEMPLQNGDAP